MSRRLRAFLILAALIAAAFPLVWRYVAAAQGDLLALAALPLAAFALGRGVAWLNRDLLRPRRLFAQERFEEAEAAADRAVARYRAAPWRARFAYLLLSFDGWDALALALNLRGAARMRLGRLDAAEADLRAAAAQDPGYAKPLHSLGVIAAARGEAAAAERCFAEAARLGFRATRTDRLISRVVDAYAKAEPTAR